MTGGVARMLPGLAVQALVTRGLRVNLLPEKAAKSVIFGLAGAQTAGAQYASLYGQLRQQGAGPMEAWMRASGPAMASGLVTAGLTAAGGATGTEALLMPGTRDRVVQGMRGFWKQTLKNVPAHAVKEVPEEFFDEMATTMIEAAALGKDPRAALGDLLAESPEFIGSVMLLGGSGGVPQSRQQKPVVRPAPHDAAPPPIWQGRARLGEEAVILGRNPDGTFQVWLDGVEKTFKESQVAAMTGLQSGPLHEMLEKAAANLETEADQAPIPSQALSAIPGSRLQFSQTNPADHEVINVHRRIAESEEAFQFGKSKPETRGNARENDWRDSLEALAEAYSVAGSPLTLGHDYPDHVGGYAFYLHTNKGSAFVVINPPDRKSPGTVQINSPGLNSNTEKAGGGTQVYQMVETFALNNGLTFLPEHTVSPIAQKRRISQMASSALRHGTTQHLNGLATYTDETTRRIKTEVPGWKPGDHDHNLALLLKAEHQYVMQEAQARGIDLSRLTHDLATNNILDGHTGTPITRAALESLVERFKPGVSGVGETTLLRALVTGSALQRGQPDRSVQHLQQDAGGVPRGEETGLSSGDLVSVARGLYYSRPPESAGGLPQRRVGDALSGGPGGLATTLAETARFLSRKLPGLINRRTHLFTTVEALLASDYARQYPFTEKQIASLRTAEGFHDSQTGHSFVIAENTRLQEGESPVQALTRVLLHERIGHDGLNLLLGPPGSPRARRWAALSAQIPPAELEAIAAEPGCRHLAERRADLAFEWFARQTETDLRLLEEDSLPRRMWEAFREMALDLMARLNQHPTLGRSFETQVQDLKRRAREAALKPPARNGSVRTKSPNNIKHPQSSSSHQKVGTGDLTATVPPIWQGRARHGEEAVILGRNPDGTFQVRLDGVEKIFKESQVAAMTGLKKGPLYEMLGQATRAAQTAQAGAPSGGAGSPGLRPIWQGQTTRGQAGVVESRNADGTFQVRINGAARTFSEPQVAAMTGLKKGPLYEMLERVTREGVNAKAARIDNEGASRFNLRRGDRSNIVIAGGLPPGQAGEFDRARLRDKSRELFGLLQAYAEAHSSGGQRQGISGVGGSNSPPAGNPSAIGATFQPDGSLAVEGSPLAWADALLRDNKENTQAALEQARATFEEEAWHVAQLVGMRNDWVKAGKPGSFVDWVHDRSAEIMESIGDAAAKATPAEAARIKTALFATWELYFAEEGHGQTPESVFRQLTSPVQRGRLVTRGTFLAEFTRQLHQAGVTGQTTETAGLLGRLKAWVQQALEGLKEAYAVVRGGVMGQPLKELIERTEAVLQGRETALPIQPGLRSGPGDAFLAGNNNNNDLIRVRLEKPMTNTKLSIPYMHETNPSQSSHTRRDAEAALRELLERAEHDARRNARADAGERIRAEAESLVSWAGENGWLVDSGRLQGLTATFKELEGGAEHHVFGDPLSGRVIKVTRPPNFGARGNLTSYLNNIQWSNSVFHDDILFEGVVMGHDGPSIVISQPFIKGESPQEGDIISWMEIQGYVPVGYNMWKHPDTGVLIADAHTGNFILTEDGFLIPIDLQVLNPGKAQ